ncbi:unnamed protein product [Protopolystoma xenopodis]|uniref:Uncharacterized protein n=1 Tax=Protopolystoma xenopodis TaxID=117903 RepID=A0A448XDS2_9PLAT|nr:unnamed protein product [Protopolystoma xenopodis]
MVSCSEDVRHMTDESSTQINRGPGAMRRGPIRTNIQTRPKAIPVQLTVKSTYDSLPLASSKEIKGQNNFHQQPQQRTKLGRKHKVARRYYLSQNCGYQWTTEQMRRKPGLGKTTFGIGDDARSYSTASRRRVVDQDVLLPPAPDSALRTPPFPDRAEHLASEIDAHLHE